MYLQGPHSQGPACFLIQEILLAKNPSSALAKHLPETYTYIFELGYLSYLEEALNEV